MELGDYLSKYRKEAGLTIDELVSLSGVPKGTINKIIAGTTKSPTLETVQSLAAALGKSINDFTDSSSREGLTADEQAHIKKYRSLDPYGKEAVDSILNIEHRRCAEPVKQKLYIAARDGSRIETEVDGEIIIPEEDADIPE